MPFSKSFAPGKKPFDFDITQISFNPQRAKVVDFSNSYYDVNQAIVGLQGDADRQGAGRSPALKSFTVRRASSGRRASTTSLKYDQAAKKPRSTTR